MKNQVENLNLHDNRRELVLKALKSKPNYTEAAAALGISRPTLRRDMSMYNIKKVGREYQVINSKKTVSKS